MVLSLGAPQRRSYRDLRMHVFAPNTGFTNRKSPFKTSNVSMTSTKFNLLFLFQV